MIESFRLISKPHLYFCANIIHSPTVRELQSTLVVRSRPIADDATPTKAPSSITAATAATSTWGVSYDTKKLLELITDRLPSYDIITYNLRGQMRLYVLALKSLASEIVDIRVAGENTGLGSVLANKVWTLLHTTPLLFSLPSNHLLCWNISFWWSSFLY